MHDEAHVEDLDLYPEESWENFGEWRYWFPDPDETPAYTDDEDEEDE